jgi:hypothetical protein
MPSARAERAPAGERDLVLKVTMRRVFWGMNYATRLNLKLALPAGAKTEELTDLDCVAFSTGADFSIRVLIADCKSGQRVSPASRAFWLAGARDYLGADRAYLVLQRKIPEAVRELAGQLSLDVVGASDLAILENVHGPHAPSAGMFGVDGVTRFQQLVGQVDKRLDRLNRFREHDYWHLPPERRLQRLIVELRAAAPALRTDQLAHRVLVLDAVFLFALSLLNACRHVSAVSLSDPREALLEYLLGGPAMTRERRQQLQSLTAGLTELQKSRGVPTDIIDSMALEPDYFEALAETVARFLRRPRDAQRVLRYVEWWAHSHEALGLPSAPDAMGGSYGGYTQKLVSDMTRTLFAAAGLETRWKALANSAGAMGEAERESADASAGSDSGRSAAQEAPDRSTEKSETSSAVQLPLDSA